MISVIVYGRNDSYGYNLPKRAALSINCIAHILDAPDDEIIFVDCNTPDDIPTFPESIADTLTNRAKELLRILRVRPEQYERGKNGAKFKVLEPLCRNIAIRRSNPANRWILNTNTDMVFTPLQPDLSLSRIVADLPDGFYELPRFEMPESLWESVDRMNPETIISDFKKWGLRLHLNEIITSVKETIFDGPGDFQLSLRSQLFQIYGMNEQMVLGWHVDTNLCKRMWLLNGETSTILDKLYAFHCDHTRIQTVYHAGGTSTENSLDAFFANVKTPYVPDQSETWGMPYEEIEEFRLDDEFRTSLLLEKILPGMEHPITGMSVSESPFDAGLYYDDHHVFPYLSDCIANIQPSSNVGYIGSNRRLIHMLAEFRHLAGHSGHILCDVSLIGGTDNLFPFRCCSGEEIYHKCSTFIFDFSMKHLPTTMMRGFVVPAKCIEVFEFARFMVETIKMYSRNEKEMVENKKLLRRFIFVGCHGSRFEHLIQQLFVCTMTPVSTYIKCGFIRDDGCNILFPIMPLHAYVIGAYKEDYMEWLSVHLGYEVSRQGYEEAEGVFNRFVGESDNAKALEALHLLKTSDVGRALLELKIMIAELDGLTALADRMKLVIQHTGSNIYQ